MNWRPQYLVVAMVLMAYSFCYADTISVTSLPSSISVTGSLSNPNDVILYTFDVTAQSSVSFQTWSYGGGTNAAGQTISAGGFLIQELALYSGGSELTELRKAPTPGAVQPRPMPMGIAEILQEPKPLVPEFTRWLCWLSATIPTVYRFRMALAVPAPSPHTAIR